MSKFQLGDKVFFVRENNVQKYAKCPDCQGQRFLTVIMGDESRVTIQCTGCSSGYEHSTGIVPYWEFSPEILCRTIRSVKIVDDTFEYDLENGSCSWYPRKEMDVFATKEEAEERAKVVIAEHNQQEIDAIKTKHRDSRSWAWNATYHRGQIKEAQSNIEYHTKKLDWANQVKKADKQKPPSDDQSQGG